jgi:predicted dehydrogenase
MDKVRFGVIGLGNMGAGHCRFISSGQVPGAVLTAACDGNEANVKKVREAFPDVKCFAKADDMMASGEIDAVIIATPHYSHPDLAMAAFKHKLHVLCEKPAGVHTKHVREMNDAHEGSGVVFAMMNNQRTNHLYRKMKELINGGAIGAFKRVYWIKTDWYRPQAYYDSSSWRATWKGEGGGALINQCLHNLDMLQWLCGMPDRLTAFVREGKWWNIEVEDEVTAFLEYKNGATGMFVTTTADYYGTDRLEISGDSGKLVCENGKLFKHTNKVPLEKTIEAYITGGIPPAGLDFDVEEIETDGKNENHVGVIKAFVGNILRGEPLIAEGKEGLNALMLVNAMYLSSWLGANGEPKAIDLPIDDVLYYNELQKKVNG